MVEQAAQVAPELARLKSRQAGLKMASANMRSRANDLMDEDEVDLASLSAAEISLREKLEKILLLDEQILDLTVSEAEITEEISSADSHNYDVQVVLQRVEMAKNLKKTLDGNCGGKKKGFGKGGARLPKIVYKTFQGIHRSILDSQSNLLLQ